MTQLLETKLAVIFVDYLKNKNRYADFINCFFFDGVSLFQPAYYFSKK